MATKGYQKAAKSLKAKLRKLNAELKELDTAISSKARSQVRLCYSHPHYVEVFTMMNHLVHNSTE